MTAEKDQTNWLPEQLEEWAKPALEYPELVEIARTAASNNQAKKEALEWVTKTYENLGQACRWLRILRAEHPERFKKLISQATQKPKPKEKKVETHKINLLGKNLEIIRPRFYFGDGIGDDKEKGFTLGSAIDGIFGCVQDYDCDMPEGYRHISIAEIAEIMNFNDNIRERNHKQREIFAELFIAYLFEKGLDLTDHQWKKGIFLSEGLRREGENLIVFKSIDGKVEIVTEAAYDTSVGHKIKDGAEIEQKKFSLERLFRKYGEKDITLKQLDKSNPDLIEYLFGKEYEELISHIQRANFILPPDFLEMKQTEGCYEKCNIWPLSIDFSIGFQKKDSILSGDHFGKQINFIYLTLKNITIFSRFYGEHFIVKEIK